MDMLDTEMVGREGLMDLEDLLGLESQLHQLVLEGQLHQLVLEGPVR